MKMPSEEAIKTAWLLYEQGKEKLEQCAELLRGPLIAASPVTMKTEIAVSNAIDALRGGFKVG